MSEAGVDAEGARRGAAVAHLHQLLVHNLKHNDAFKQGFKSGCVNPKYPNRNFSGYKNCQVVVGGSGILVDDAGRA